MHAHNPRALRHACKRSSHARMHPLRRHIAPGERTQRALSRPACEHWIAQRNQFAQSSRQCDVVLQCLAKSKPWIKGDSITRDARSLANHCSFKQKFPHLAHHVRVHRCSLHRPRLPLHVHQHYADVTRRANLHRPRIRQRRHIINDGRTGSNRLPHDLRFVRINRHAVPSRRQRLNHRQNAIQLLLKANRRRTRTR